MNIMEKKRRLDESFDIDGCVSSQVWVYGFSLGTMTLATTLAAVQFFVI